ncbi:MAG: hypothetical protein QOF84_291 [Streptomyces sp.]|jgi:hypothetical protein|nr:hypothetical protein [Streptomyces sp.]
MAYYEDLSPYGYFTETIPPGISAACVGWLDPDHDHPTADPDSAFADRLFALTRDHRSAVTSSWHGCLLCPRRLFGTSGRPYPVKVSRLGGEILVGHGELRLRSASPGTWLIAPDLVVHYVTAHRYAPPAAFVEAVMVGRVVAHSL